MTRFLDRPKDLGDRPEKTIPQRGYKSDKIRSAAGAVRNRAMDENPAL